MATRYNINDFGLANPAYVGATVSFWTVSGGAKTATLATLYAAATGSTTLTNPRALDSDGKFAVPVYVEVPVIATVSGLTVADHDTGIMGLAEVAASASATAAAVSAAAALVSQSAAGVSAAAALVSENNAAATLANALLKTGGTMTGDLTMGVGKVVIFEGATDDGFEATLTAADPTADRTITLPDETCELGFRNVPQNSQSTAYSLVLSDSGKHLLHPSADTTARTFTIPANSAVAYPVGTAITFVNQASAGVMTIAITTDTMRLAGAGTTGSRTLAANGIATALKLTATEWIISGTGLT